MVETFYCVLNKSTRGLFMKMKQVAAAVMGLAMSTAFAAQTTAPTTDLDKLSYSIGADLGKKLPKDLDIFSEFT